MNMLSDHSHLCDCEGCMKWVKAEKMQDGRGRQDGGDGSWEEGGGRLGGTAVVLMMLHV